MTGDTARRTAAKRGLVLAVCLWLAVAPTVAAAGTAATGGTVTAGGHSGATAEVVTADASAALAGSTTVRLDPTTASVDEGATRTLNVVVSSADNGVGAVSGEISVVESEYAEIVDLELRGDPQLQEISPPGDSVTFEGALMDTPQSGAVTVAQVTVRGQLEGRTDLALQIDSLGDEDGDPYDVGGTPDTALTVENTRNQVPLSITADADSATVGESLAFTVMRSDSDARVEANVTVDDRTVTTGVDGEATVVVRESMVSDAGTVTAVASKDPTSQERYTNDSVTLSVDDSGSGGSGGADDGSTDDGSGSAGSGDGAIVRTDPGSIDLTAGATTTVDVVVADIDGGVGAGNLTFGVTDPGVATITDATVTGAPDIGGAEVGSDGATVTAEFALRDGADTPPVRIATVTLRGVAAGSTTLSLSASSLGDESGNSYAIASAPDSGINVVESGDADTGTTTPEPTATDSPVATDTPTAGGSDSTDGGTDSTTTAGSAGSTTTDSGTDSTATDGGSTGTASQNTTAGDGGTDSETQPSDTGDSPTEDSPVPTDSSTALLATGAVVVFLLGLLVVAAS